MMLEDAGTDTRHSRIRALYKEREECEAALRSAIASRDELDDLFATSMRYGDSQVVEMLRWPMSQALSACDDCIDGARGRLRRSEDALGEALGRS